jgi:hypothetical protein
MVREDLQAGGNSCKIGAKSIKEVAPMAKKDKWEELEEYLNSWLAQAKGCLEEAEDINEMERAILEMTRKLGRRMFRAALESKGEQVEGRECHACGGETKRNGRDGRKLVTLVGEVEFERQRVRCKECGEDFSPSRLGDRALTEG